MLMLMAGDEGFEPPIAEPESAALPLGQSPVREMGQTCGFSHRAECRNKFAMRAALFPELQGSIIKLGDRKAKLFGMGSAVAYN